MTQVKMLKKVGAFAAGTLRTLPDREARQLIADKSAELVQQFWTNDPPKVDDKAPDEDEAEEKTPAKRK